MPIKSILIIEDDEMIAAALMDILSSEGFIVNWAKNGALALQRLQIEETPNLILLDLMMPVMNGFEFRENQERDKRLSEIPTVVMTAGLDYKNADPRIKNVASCFRKPIVLKPFLDNIHQLAV